MSRFAGALAACAALAAGRPAGAAPALVGAAEPTELRVALASTPDLVTTWTSVRLADGAGPFAIVVPLPDGAYVDQSSDAWFEALEVATAPRVLPPAGLSPFCPEEGGPETPFETAGFLGHEPSLLPETLTLVDDAAAVAAWASQQGLSVSADLQGALGSVPAAKFLCVRFTAPGGPALTPTLRVAAPLGLPALPFSITRAGASDLRVTTWLVGEGRGTLDGTTGVTVPESGLVWNAKEQASNYLAVRGELLAADAASVLLEAASHDALAAATPFAGGAASIAAVATTYFERASEYGNASMSPGPCTDSAQTAFASTLPVGPVCPRADLAALAGQCVPVAPEAGETDPASFLCGAGADDLAVAVGGAVPAKVWLARRTFLIPADSAGKDRAVSFPSSTAKVPVLQTASVDLGDCFGGAGGTGGAGGSTGTTSSTSGTTTATGTGGTGASSGQGGYGNTGQGAGDGDGDTDPSVYVDTSGCACGAPIDSTESTTPVETESGESTESGGDDCGGDSSSSSSSGSSSESGDDCGGDSSSSSSSDSSSSDDSGDSCGGDSSSSSSTPDDGSSDDGSSDSGASGSGGYGSSSTGAQCAVSQGKPSARRSTGIRLSALSLGIAVVLLPLRRRGTRKRRGAPASS